MLLSKNWHLGVAADTCGRYKVEALRRFTFMHYNPNKGVFQYNSFHKTNAHEAVDAYKEKGYRVENVKWIKDKKKVVYERQTGWVL